MLLFGVVLAFGFWFRIYALQLRPMHTDEAVHAAKFGALLDDGFYAYDPNEYHGPTLNYFTRIIAFLRGQASYIQIDEKTLRLVPAVFGILLMLTPLLFFDGIGLRAAFISVALLALSPLFVFYSRYYIQETPLVCFTAAFLGGLWRYWRTGRVRWMILAGVCAGLMAATKETYILTVAAFVLSLLITLKWVGFPSQASIRRRDGLLGLLLALLVYGAFYSSFGSNLRGIADSFSTYLNWMKHSASNNIHAHPWYWYFKLLTWNEFTERVVWNEDGIVVAALFGIAAAFRRSGINHTRNPFCVLLAFFTLLLTAFYCLIPYKTPWCVLSFVYGMVLLGGFAADTLLKTAEAGWSRTFIWLVFVVIGLISPVIQTVLLNTAYCASPGNPWVYAHTSRDIFTIEQTVRQAAAASPEGKAMPVQVVAPGHDYWPLPWYLRDFSAVAYTNAVDSNLPKPSLVLYNAQLEQDVLRGLYRPKPGFDRGLYVPLFRKSVELRPAVQWGGAIAFSLWEQMASQSSANADANAVHANSDYGKIMSLDVNRSEYKGVVKFSHQAMNTVFEVFIQAADPTYAGRAARSAFNEVDRLEQQLSRFIENSDISRINNAAKGELLSVSSDVMACLVVAKQVCDRTGGAFDITVGPLVDLWRKGEPAPEQIAAILKTRTGEPFILDPNALTVTVLRENIGMDLGGVAKGYAVDCIADILREWNIERAIIHCGASSVRTLQGPEDKPGWPIVLTNPHDPNEQYRLELANQSLSCSGLHRGSHIINPADGKPVLNKRAVWLVTTQSAAVADAATTALMVMPIDAVEQYAKSSDDCIIVIPAESITPLQYGKNKCIK